MWSGGADTLLPVDASIQVVQDTVYPTRPLDALYRTVLSRLESVVTPFLGQTLSRRQPIFPTAIDVTPTDILSFPVEVNDRIVQVQPIYSELLLT